MSTQIIDVRSQDPSSREPQRPASQDGSSLENGRIDIGISSIEHPNGWGWGWYQHPESWGVGIVWESSPRIIEMEALFNGIYAMPQERNVAVHTSSPRLHKTRANLREMLMAESMGQPIGGYDVELLRELNLLFLSRSGKETTVLHKPIEEHPLINRAHRKIESALEEKGREGSYDPGPDWSEAPAPKKRRMYQGPPRPPRNLKRRGRGS